MLLDMITVIRKQRGMSIEELSEKSGVPLGTLSKISAGITKDPKLDTVRAIAKALECKLDDLDDDSLLSENSVSVEEMNHIKKYRTLDPYSQETVSMVLDREAERKNNLIREDTAEHNIIPMRTISYYQRVSADTGKLIYGDVVADPIEIPEIPEYRYVNYAVGIDGDSMEPEYFDGEVLLVEQTDAVEIGEIGIFLVDDDAYIKELGHNELISLNKRHPNIPLDEHSRCMGRVIGTLE